MIRIRDGVLCLSLWLCLANRAGALTPADRYVVDAASDLVTDTRTGLIWQRAVPAQAHTWDGARAYCSVRGWRLPGLRELLTLVDVTRVNPSIDPVFSATPPDRFWTASNRSGGAWFVDFQEGGAGSTSISTMYRVRCVR